MWIWRPLWTVAVIFAICGAGLAQAPSPGLPSGLPTRNVQPPKVPPLPYDPLELVTSNAQQIQDADQRAAAITLLTNARALSNVRAQPYDLNTTFKSFGSLPSDGAWTLEEVSPSSREITFTFQAVNSPM
jgi:hypothetical protein